MPRFFLPPDFILSETDSLPDEISLNGEEAFHLSVSLRARIGEKVVVCTANGIELQCEIVSIYGGKKAPVVVLKPLKATPSQNESPISVTVFQAMPKGKKTDSILQKCTELGANSIVFFYSDYSVPTADSDSSRKEDRFRKICEEAAKQCGRGKLVNVSILSDTESALQCMKQYDTSFVCYEKEGERSLKQILSDNGFRSAAFLVGPEGGLSPEEVHLVTKMGIPTVTLGKRILRTETAASAVLSMFLYEKEL